jgi:RNA polymerase sigma-70 factor (ECF subfamily)
MLTLTMAGDPPNSWANTAEAGAREAPTLMALAASGDRNALAALLREHGQAIGQLCHFVAGPRDGRDAAQEAFERIVVSVAKYDPTKGSFRSWALTVARNVCRDRLRRRGLERAAFLSDGETQTDLARTKELDPEASAVLRADVGTLEAALATLPEQMRTALVLFHFHEASYEEIAAALEVPIGTVMTWLHRGRKRLKASLEEAA